MITRIIKSDEEYQQALERLSDLMDAEAGSPEGEELELLSVLLEKYESEHFPIQLPDPVEAIKFRMEQQGLTRKDLVPYLGSQSKVSEVLNGKRPLSLSMIRALHAGLGIPAEVLLREPGKELAPRRFDIRDFPFASMFRQGYFPWFRGSQREAKEIGEELLERLFAPLQGRPMQRVYCRQSAQARIPGGLSQAVAEASAEYEAGSVPSKQASQRNHTLNEQALAAWHAKALVVAEGQKLPPYTPERINTSFVHELVHLSYYSKGPLLARELLAKNGIALVTLPHLPRTYLDGACFRTRSGRPVIGLTLRYDRLDNFWFTLVHELAHVMLHLDGGLAFFDDTEDGSEIASDPREQEANAFTWEVLIPPDIWEREKELLLHTEEAEVIVSFADTLHLSPAIVAGRVRWETGDYTRYNTLIGSKQVKRLFEQDEGDQ